MAFIKCPKCDAILEDSVSVCPICGYSFKDNPEPWAEAFRKKVTIRKLIWLLSFFALAILGIVFFTLLKLDVEEKGDLGKTNGVFFALTILSVGGAISTGMINFAISARKVMIWTYEGRSVAVYRHLLNTEVWVNNRMVERKTTVGVLSFTVELPTGKHVFISVSRDLCTFELVEKEEKAE
jgi:hypothetical protein